LRDRPGAAAGDESRGARLGQASALLARDHGNSSVVRRHGGLHRCGPDRPLERGAAMTEASKTSAAESAPRTITLRGRKVVGGVSEGEALVTRQTISGWGGVNPMQGTVIEVRHELRGVSFKVQVLVFPGAKGSSGCSVMLHTCPLAG